MILIPHIRHHFVASVSTLGINFGSNRYIQNISLATKSIYDPLNITCHWAVMINILTKNRMKCPPLLGFLRATPFVTG